MRYLIKYKLFEQLSGWDDIEVSCRDILSDLEDDGFQIIVAKSPLSFLSNRRYVHIFKREEFTIDDIKSTLDRIYSYLKSEDLFIIPRGEVLYTFMGGWGNGYLYGFEIFTKESLDLYISGFRREFQSLYRNRVI